MRKSSGPKKAGRENEKGFSLAAIVFAMLALGAVGASMTATLSNSAFRATADLKGQKAFFIAETGMQYTLAQYFRDDLDFSDNAAPTPAPYASGAISFGDGEFWVEYLNVTPTSATVKVTAKTGDSVRTIQQTVEQIIPLSYAFAGTNNLILSGSGELNGNVSSGGSVNVNNGFVVNGTIYQDNSITLPTVDLAEYIALTDSTDTNGTLNIAGNYTGNIYATGNVRLQNNANVTGIIVCDGNIDIGTNVTFNGTMAAGGNIFSNSLQNGTFTWQYGPQGQVLPVMASEGNITLTAKEAGGNATTAMINGLLISDGDINLNKVQDSTFIINGFMFANGTSNSSAASGDGNTIINYDSGLANAVAQNNLRLSGWKEI